MSDAKQVLSFSASSRKMIARTRRYMIIIMMLHAKARILLLEKRLSVINTIVLTC